MEVDFLCTVQSFFFNLSKLNLCNRHTTYYMIVFKYLVCVYETSPGPRTHGIFDIITPTIILNRYN